MSNTRESQNLKRAFELLKEVNSSLLSRYLLTAYITEYNPRAFKLLIALLSGKVLFKDISKEFKKENKLTSQELIQLIRKINKEAGFKETGLKLIKKEGKGKKTKYFIDFTNFCLFTTGYSEGSVIEKKTRKYFDKHPKIAEEMMKKLAKQMKGNNSPQHFLWRYEQLRARHQSYWSKALKS